MVVYTHRAFAAVVTLVAAAAALCVVGVSAQTHHVVGGDDGWGPTSNVASWANGRIFRVGDKLLFHHSGPEESIVEVTNADEYESCDLNNPIEMYTHHVHLDKPGPRYFMSSNIQNCKNGLKLPISVQPNSEFGPFDPVEPFQPGPGFGPSDPLKPDPKFEPPEPFHPDPEYDPPGRYDPPAGYEPPSRYEPPGGYEPPSRYEPPGGYEPPSRYEPPGGYEPPGEYEPPVKPDLPPPPPLRPSAATQMNAGLSVVLLIGMLNFYL